MIDNKAQRRSQRERTAAARDNLIKATQDSLTELGFARTTVSEICKRANVSSGALLHHFPNKNVVIVAAYISRQAELLAEAVMAGEDHVRTVREEVLDLRRQMEATFPLSYEFFWALRTDSGLREEFQHQLKEREIELSREFTFPSSELGSYPSPLLARSVIACFLRGLMLEALVSDRRTVDEICDYFVEMMGAFVQAHRRRQAPDDHQPS
jgi:AcrR family transcriptional regulator